MTTNQKATAAPVSQTVAQTANGQVFARTRASLANFARSFRTRQRVVRELSSLSDRALADLGLYRSDIEGFARDASRIVAAETLIAALTADLRALFGSSAGRKVARRPI